MYRKKLSIAALFIAIVTILHLGSTISVFADNVDSEEKKIIVFYKAVTTSQKEAVLKKHGADVLKTLSGINGFVVNLPKGSNLAGEKVISYVEDDSIISINKKLAPKPTISPILSVSKAPIPTPQPELIPWGVEFVKAPLLWGQVDTSNVKVGVIDTGIDLDHPDLKNNVKGGFNTLNSRRKPEDDNGHGTHVAGIIAAAKNNVGVVGIMPDADLYAIKALDSSGKGYISDIIEGIDWAINNNMDVINMSLGTTINSQSLHDIIVSANNAGIIMVAAAGNNYGGSCEYPAAYPEVISVGAIGRDGSIANFSALQGVDVFAPGVDIYSTYINDSYATMDGTSAACPHYILSQLLKK